MRSPFSTKVSEVLQLSQDRAKEELFSSPLQSCSHSRILKTELRNRDETWKKYETWGAPDRKGPCRVVAARAGCLRAVPRRGWRGLHTGVGCLASSCTRCGVTDTPLPSSCFHYQWGKCNWEKARMTQGSHGQMLHVPKSWKQIRVTVCWERANWIAVAFASSHLWAATTQATKAGHNNSSFHHNLQANLQSK